VVFGHIVSFFGNDMDIPEKTNNDTYLTLYIYCYLHNQQFAHFLSHENLEIIDKPSHKMSKYTM